VRWTASAAALAHCCLPGNHDHESQPLRSTNALNPPLDMDKLLSMGHMIFPGRDEGPAGAHA
jgi:hypothetical protein